MNWWRLWAKAIGQKEGSTNYEADIVAAIRTFLILTNLITCGFIVAGVIRHW